MKEFRITLIGDGSSDETLLEIVKWLINDLFPKRTFQFLFADFGYLPDPPSKSDPKKQIEYAKKYYPYDLLIYHRDAESNNIEMVAIRKAEILSKIGQENLSTVICMVPVKMMETWLLIDKEAIKKASGNRKYPGNIPLPPISKLEKETNPKEILHNLLKEVSNLRGRRLDKFKVQQKVNLVAEFIENYEKLRNLTAFKIFEQDFLSAMENLSQK